MMIIAWDYPSIRQSAAQVFDGNRTLFERTISFCCESKSETVSVMIIAPDSLSIRQSAAQVFNGNRTLSERTISCVYR